jgi:chromosome segregation ATPase
MVDPMNAFKSHANAEKPTYTVSVLLEEIGALRKRVKELEDDGSCCDRSTVVSTIDEQRELEAEVVSLRKEVAKVEHEKADMELQFMNHMASQEREHQGALDILKEKLVQSKEENLALRDLWASGEKAEQLQIHLEDLRGKHELELQQLQDDLAAADREIEINRQDMDDMREQMVELENMKMTLLDEVTSLRVQLDEEAKAANDLQSQLQDVDAKATAKITKLEQVISERDASIEKLQTELGEMNDEVIGLEDQKAMLLDEITGLRMQVEREQEAHANFKARVNSSNNSVSSSSSQPTSNDNVEVTVLRERVKVLEVQAAVLQAKIKELESGRVSADTSKMEELLQESLKEEQQRRVQVMSELEEMKDKLKEKESEIASLNQQRVSYEERTTRNIMDQVAEADYHKSQTKKLSEELKAIKEKLAAPNDAVAKLGKNGTKPLLPRPSPLSYSQSSSPACPESPPPSTSSASGLPWKPRMLRSSSTPGDPSSVSSPRTPVRSVVESFERRISMSSSVHGTSSTQGPHAASHLFAPSPPTMPDDLPSLSVEAQLDVLKQDLEVERAKVRQLQERLSQESEVSAELRAEMASLSANEVSIAEYARRENEKDRQNDKEQISRLTSQVEALERELDAALTQIEELKKEIKNQPLTVGKASVVDEAKIKDIEKRAAKKYDAEVNNLKVELTKVLMIKADMELEYTNKVKELEDSFESMQAEIQEELEENKKQIDDLRLSLNEKDDEIARLQREREQICTSMNSMSSSKRGEMEELQTELLDMNAKTTSQVREIQALRMKIEELEYRREDADMLRRKVLELETQLKNSRNTRAQISDAELEKLQQENSKLRESLRTVTLERRSLHEKLTTAASDKDSRSMQVLRERNSALKQEVEKLTKRLRRVEGSITRVAI